MKTAATDEYKLAVLAILSVVGILSLATLRWASCSEIVSRKEIMECRARHAEVLHTLNECIGRERY